MIAKKVEDDFIVFLYIKAVNNLLLRSFCCKMTPKVIKMACKFTYDTYKSKETQTFYVYIVSTVAIRCLSLQVPENGVKTGCSDTTSEPYDKHCSFSCDVGFNLTGSAVRRCLENGSWSGQRPHCQSMINKNINIYKIKMFKGRTTFCSE